MTFQFQNLVAVDSTDGKPPNLSYGHHANEPQITAFEETLLLPVEGEDRCQEALGEGAGIDTSGGDAATDGEGFTKDAPENDARGLNSFISPK